MTTPSASSFPAVVWRRCLKWISWVRQRRHARELRNRAWSRIDQLDATYDAQIVDEVITIAREAYEISLEIEADGIDACILLVESLRQRLNYGKDDSVLEEMITLGRKALALSPKRHPERAHSCGNLAISLWARYEHTGSVSFLDEAIDLEHEVLALQPTGHPDHSASCRNLAAVTHSHARAGAPVFISNP
jgi:hypothetical protein